VLHSCRQREAIDGSVLRAFSFITMTEFNDLIRMIQMVRVCIIEANVARSERPGDKQKSRCQDWCDVVRMTAPSGMPPILLTDCNRRKGSAYPRNEVSPKGISALASPLI